VKIEWTRKALDDFRAEVEYIAQDRPLAAERWAEKIRHAVSLLRQFPLRGRRIPEKLELAERELIVSGYRVVYRPELNRVLLVAIQHSRFPLALGSFEPDSPEEE
jgi:toxin ParE1/3/4